MSLWIDVALSNALLATVLAVAVWAVVCFVDRPSVALGLWLLVSAKLLTPAVVDLPLPTWRSEVASYVGELVAVEVDRGATSESTQDMQSVRAATSVDPLPAAHAMASPWVAAGKAFVSLSNDPWLLFAWAGGSIGFWLLAAVRMARFSRLLARAPRATAELDDDVKRLAPRIGLAQAPHVRVLAGGMSPLAWGMIGRATIVLPSELIERLTQRERDSLIAHELAHLARRDHWIGWFELVVLGLYWWHPIAWWARRKASEAAEACCAEGVLSALPDHAPDYAQAMLSTVEFLGARTRAVPLGANRFSQARTLKRRLKMVLEGSGNTESSWPLRGILLLLAIAVLPLSIRSLWAEGPAKAEDTANQSSATLDDVMTEVGPSPRFSEEQLEAQQELFAITRHAAMTLELSKTNLKRMLAAERQLKAVEDAYAAETVTIDQLLESQRRLAETHSAYVRTMAELSTDPRQRERLTSVAELGIYNDALKRARELWKEEYRKHAQAQGGQQESRDEAAAREQYFQLKKQTQALVVRYLESHNLEIGADGPRVEKTGPVR